MTKQEQSLVIGTHDGEFHPDDVYACATAIQALTERGQSYPPNVEIIRSRDPEQLAECDLLIDVGMVYDPGDGKFDHHQPEGAGQRENGIPYAAFGLIWQEFGLTLCDGDEDAFAHVDEHFIQVIDAYDNQIPLYESTLSRDVQPGQDIMNFNRLTDGFDKAIATARLLLEGRVATAQAEIASLRPIREIIDSSEDKRVIVLPVEKLDWQSTIPELDGADDAKFVIEPEGQDWVVRAVPVRPNSVERRALLPDELRGIEDRREIERICGVTGIDFVHGKGFFARATSLASARSLVHQSLDDLPRAA